MKKKDIILGIVLIAFISVTIFYFGREYQQRFNFGAPQQFVSTSATGTDPSKFAFLVGTTTALTSTGTTTAAIYGSTTIQTPVDSLNAFSVINAASSTIFQIDTINSSSTFASDLNFYDEIRPDGSLCANDQILKKTGADNWDCASDLTSSFGQNWELTAAADALAPTTTVGIIVSASSTFIGDFTIENPTSTTTLNSGLTIETSGFVYDFSSNNVGIGTAVPSVPLDVRRSNAGQVATFSIPGNNVGTVGFYKSGGTTEIGVIQFDGQGDNSFDILATAGSNNPLILGANSTERMRITGAGRVGIGTTSPGALLSVGGDILGNIIYGANFVATSSSATSTFAGGLAIETSGLVYDFSSNNVGIGTAAPTSKLTLQGSTNSVAGSALVINSNFNDGVYVNLGDNRTIGVFNGGNLFMGFNTYYDTVSNSYEHATNGEAALTEWTTGGDIEFLTSVSAAAETEYVPDLRMIIQNTGNVGIGTSTPGALLSVGGDILGNIISSAFFIATTTSTSTFAGGLQIDGGCVSVGGNCLWESKVSSTIYASSTLVFDGDYNTAATTTYVLANYPAAITLKSLFCKVTFGTGTARVEIGTGTASSTLVCTTSGVESTTQVNFGSRDNYLISIGTRTSDPSLFTVTDEIILQ